jgi:hypothetical protein
MRSISDTINESMSNVVFMLNSDDIDTLRDCLDESGVVTLALGVKNGKAEYLSANVDGKWETIK